MRRELWPLWLRRGLWGSGRWRCWLGILCFGGEGGTRQFLGLGRDWVDVKHNSDYGQDKGGCGYGGGGFLAHGGAERGGSVKCLDGDGDMWAPEIISAPRGGDARFGGLFRNRVKGLPHETTGIGAEPGRRQSNPFPPPLGRHYMSVCLAQQPKRGANMPYGHPRPARLAARARQANLTGLPRNAHGSFLPRACHGGRQGGAHAAGPQIPKARDHTSQM